MRTKLTRAIKFARHQHRYQKDDSGESYFRAHLEPVVLALSELTDDEDIICAAVLHDVLEDTEATYNQLAKQFGKRIADLVHEMTCEGKKDSYGFYFPRLKSAEAILIKLIDRASNVSRMESWAPNRRKQYLKKTKFWKDGSDK